jgi:PAS domain S-box-containing protein
MKKILVVDDQKVVLDFMTKLLEKEGHHVMTAEGSLSALELLETETPDIIFVDLIMPNIGGEKLCQIIRMIPRLKNVYVIILSAVAAEQRPDIAALGANACIAKGPFSKMGQHVMAALEQSDLEGAGGLQEKILGLEDVYPRHVTKELLSVRRHFEVILGSMSEGILEITLEGRIVYANPSAISLVGMTEEKLLGSEFGHLFPETYHQRIQGILGSAMSGGPDAAARDVPVILNSKDILLNILAVEDEEHASVLIILNDVTERKRLEAQLRQAHKMEAIGTLAGGVAHGFNNLLMRIHESSAMLLRDKDASNPNSDLLRNIEKQVQSGVKLTSHLLGCAREERYEVKAVDLNEYVEETSEAFGRGKKEITIHRELAKDLFPIEADPVQIDQVLWSLYVNAAEAMAGGGDLILKTTNVTHEDMHGKLYEPKAGDYVLLTVVDTGKGMDKETVERVFDPFFTTKEVGTYKGLGLTSAYGIIKGHGGYIEIESMEGQGTSVSVYLPASEKKG